MKNIKVVSLFSGIGGFEEGLKKANIPFEIVMASEIDKNACISYAGNFDNSNLLGDITKINENDVPDHDFLVAGFPCQAFSIAGNRYGFNDTRGTLFFDVARILKAKMPKYFLLENVKNLVSHDSGKTIRVIMNTLNEIGYTCDITVINSEEAGVPQNRERTYIIGILGQEREPYVPDSRNKKIAALKDELNNKGFRSFNFFSDLVFHNRNQFLKDILENEVEDKYYFNTEKMSEFLNNLSLDEETVPTHSIVKLFDVPRDVINDLERQRRVYSIYGISPTVLARTDSTKIFVVENGEKRVRKVTPEENFYIQGYDKQFVKNIKKTVMTSSQMYKQSGNAVSPPVIAGIVKQLYTTHMQTKFSFIDLFCGLGGFRIAFEKMGGECVFSSDIDKYARETYFNNFHEYPSGDITKINENDIPNHDILCAGFPCQPFSLAGKRLGFEDTRGTLFFDVARILKAKKPIAFFLENVSGLANHDNGKTLKVITHTLNELGYTISYKVINAYKIGFPQNRNRWYCIGIRNDKIGDFSLEDIFPAERELLYTVEDCIEPNASSDYNISDVCISNINARLPEYKASGRYVEGNEIIAYEIRKSRCNFRSDHISPCLTAKMGTGGNNIPVVVSQMRKLTERECLRIMGFPDYYDIEKLSYQSYKQIGNSVVVPVIESIANNLVDFLEEQLHAW